MSFTSSVFDLDSNPICFFLGCYLCSSVINKIDFLAWFVFEAILK